MHFETQFQFHEMTEHFKSSALFTISEEKNFSFLRRDGLNVVMKKVKKSGKHLNS